MQLTASFILAALATAASASTLSDATAAIAGNKAALVYCESLVDAAVATVTVTKHATVTDTVKATETDYTTTKVKTTLRPTSTVTVGVNSTIIKTQTITLDNGGTTEIARRHLPTAMPHLQRIKRATKPSVLSKYSNSVLESACKAAIKAAKVTKTVTETSTVHKTQTRTVTDTKTKTETETASTKVVTATSTMKATSTVTATATSTAQATAYAFAIRERSSGHVLETLTLDDSDYLVVGGDGETPYATFVQQSASGSYKTGYFVNADDDSLCLGVHTYASGYLYFLTCPSSPLSFVIDASTDYNFVALAKNKRGVVYNNTDAAVAFDYTTTSPLNGLSWTAGNA